MARKIRQGYGTEIIVDFSADKDSLLASLLDLKEQLSGMRKSIDDIIDKFDVNVKTAEDGESSAGAIMD